MKNKDSVLGSQPLARSIALARAWKEVERQMRDCQVFSSPSGVKLVPRRRRPTPGGYRHHPFMCPSKRRNGVFDFQLSAESIECGRLWRVCQSLATQLQSPDVSYTSLDEVLAQSGVPMLGSSHPYTRLRFARWLLRALGLVVEPSEEDWYLLSQMGNSVEQGAQLAKIKSYARALSAFRAYEAALAASGASFKVDLGDFVCFLCLSQNSEVQGHDAPQLPPSPCPVSIKEDLGLESPVLAPVAARRLRIRQKMTVFRVWKLSPLPAASGAQPRVAVFRVWKASILKGPAASGEVAASTLGLIDWLEWRSAAALAASCKTTHAGGFTMFRRVGKERRRLANCSYELLMDFLQWPGQSLADAGVPKGMALRVVSTVWAWLDELPASFFGMGRHRDLMFALVRLAAKTQLLPRHRDTVMTYFMRLNVIDEQATSDVEDVLYKTLSVFTNSACIRHRRARWKHLSSIREVD